MDLFALKFKNNNSVSSVLHPLASAVDVLSLPWEDLDAYAFPTSYYTCLKSGCYSQVPLMVTD